MSSESEVPAPASAAASESSPTSTSSAEETKTVATTATSSATSSSTADLEAEVATLRKKLATSESVLQENKKDIAALKKSLALTQSFVESSSVRTNLVVDVPTQHTSWIRAIAQSPSSQWLVSGGGDGSLQIWDLQSHQSVAFIKRAASQWIRSLCFHPTEDIFLVVSSDTEVQLWARKDGESKTTAKTSSSSSSSSSSSAPSSATSTGKKSSSSSSSSSSSGKNDTGGWSKIGSVYTSVGGHDITWSPDGTKFVIGTFGSGALVYEARFNEDFTNWNPRLQHTLSHPGASDIFAVAWNPSGTFIATGNKNRETTIWDAESGMHLCQLSKMPSEVRSLQFSPDGFWLAVGGYNKEIRLYDTSSLTDMTQVPTSQLTIHTDTWRVAFHPTGLLLAVGSYGSTKVDIVNVADDTVQQSFDASAGISVAPTSWASPVWTNNGRVLITSAGNYLRHYVFGPVNPRFDYSA